MVSFGHFVPFSQGSRCRFAAALVMLCACAAAHAQQPASGTREGNRLGRIQRSLDSLAREDARFNARVDISVTRFPVAELLKTLAVGNRLNMNIALDGHRGQFTCNLDQVPVKDVLLLCCRDGGVDLSTRDGIVTVSPWHAPEAVPEIRVHRDSSGHYDLDYSGCTLDALVRRLVQETGQNIVCPPSLSSKKVWGFGVGLAPDKVVPHVAASCGVLCERDESGAWRLGAADSPASSSASSTFPSQRKGSFCVRLFPMQCRTVDHVVEVIPEALSREVAIKVFPDLNSLVLSGDAIRVEAVEEFLRDIDHSVPLISIDVMLVETVKSREHNSGLGFGLRSEATGITTGTFSPGTDLSLGAETINRLLNILSGLGTLNLGQVGENFFASLKLLEKDGAIVLRSTPRLATLNGHKAVLKNGEVKYYKESQVNIIGTQNPLQSESWQWKSVEANFVLDITPVVSADSTITLRIELNQDEFTERDGDENAPPGLTKRSFNSIVKVRDGETVLLGGIERTLRSKESSGLPGIARIPFLRFLFGKVGKKKEERCLNVFIKPSLQ